jgi:hypothetical protein
LYDAFNYRSVEASIIKILIHHMQKIFLNISLNLFLLNFLLVNDNVLASDVRVHQFIDWYEVVTTNKTSNSPSKSYFTFKNAIYASNPETDLPYFSYKHEFTSNTNVDEIKIIPIKTRYIDAANHTELGNALFDFVVNWQSGIERKSFQTYINLVPVRKNTNKLELLEEFEIIIKYRVLAPKILQQNKTDYKSESVLATGIWLKYWTNNTGIHRITPSMLRQHGIDPGIIDPRTIKIFGNGPGMLPSPNSAFRIDDLRENNIIVTGEQDGRFDDGDEILFYAKSQRDVWRYDSSSQDYTHETNLYSDATAYFLTFGGSAGKRVPKKPSLSHTRITNSYDNLFYYERDLVNLIKSGKRFMGEEFSRNLSQTFTANMGNVIAEDGMIIRSSVAARSFTPSSFRVNVNNQNQITHNIPAVGSSYTSRFASDIDGLRKVQIPTATSTVVVNYTYNQSIQSSVGWLDYFEVQTRNRLSVNNGQLLIRDKNAFIQGGVTRYEVQATSQDFTVWDVTVPGRSEQIATENVSSGFAFTAAGDTLREILIFNGRYHTPDFGGRVSNQNIHGLPPADYFIVVHENFLSEANRLANHHRAKRNIRVHVISINQIYNEFSSGMQDITAIRDMMRMFYKKASSILEMPKALLLFGRASYDFKSRITNNTNFVPTFQSWESLDPIRSYCSDDYFGLLDDNEGMWDSPSDFGWNGVKESLDLAIGRLPATDAGNAAVMVNKVLQYENNPEWGDWMNRMVFIADDEDGGIHENQANSLADFSRANFANYNIQKIFIDAYPEVVMAGGVRNPQAQADIVRSVERGCFLFNYTGHGGEVGLAAERIFMTEDINGLNNSGKLPLMVTATCEFSRFDDPARFAAGELTLLNPNGGSIALFTTVRLVFSGANFALNQYFLNRIGLDSFSLTQPKNSLGEIMRLTKNDYIFVDKNERNFTLLGDPAMFLAIPQYKVNITHINNMPNDTIKAFSRVTVKGNITDANGGAVSTFNGVVIPTVLDKVSTFSTLRNNPEAYNPAIPALTFDMQVNVIHRGQASVNNGLFEFTFIVPKDISYEFGNGRISCYAHNRQVDATGAFTNFMVGGTADSIPDDKKGPEIKLYLNDEKFASGALTNESPLLIAKLRDENGINITGRGIGRDIQSVINNDNLNATVLNDFYQSTLDSYQEGEVRYKMKNLEPGRHTLKLTAWDVFNNYNEANIEFIVASDENIALKHLLNYPNPFTTYTTFHFDHNKPGIPIQVMIQIFTISGKLIKSLNTETVTNGNHFDQINWDGRDEFGDQLAKGVYIYKVKLKSQDGKSAEEFQKLVILN